VAADVQQVLSLGEDLVADDVLTQQALKFDRRRPGMAHRVTVRSTQDARSASKRSLRFLERGDQAGDVMRQEFVVVVEPRREFSARERQSIVACATRTTGAAAHVDAYPWIVGEAQQCLLGGCIGT